MSPHPLHHRPAYDEYRLHLLEPAAEVRVSSYGGASIRVEIRAADNPTDDRVVVVVMPIATAIRLYGGLRETLGSIEPSRSTRPDAARDEEGAS